MRARRPKGLTAPHLRVFARGAQAMRRKKAAEGRQKLADREADYKQRERDLKDMKKNTKAAVDDDVNDDLVDTDGDGVADGTCLLYTSPSPRDQRGSRMPSSA